MGLEAPEDQHGVAQHHRRVRLRAGGMGGGAKARAFFQKKEENEGNVDSLPENLKYYRHFAFPGK